MSYVGSGLLWDAEPLGPEMAGGGHVRRRCLQRCSLFPALIMNKGDQCLKQGP